MRSSRRHVREAPEQSRIPIPRGALGLLANWGPERRVDLAREEARFYFPMLSALVGLAAQTGVVMIVYIDHAYERRLRKGRINSLEDIIEAHAEGAIQRVRSRLMTVSTMLIGLVPLLWAQGSGADVMKRITAPMVGGLVTSAFPTLEIRPVIYTYWRNEQLLWKRIQEVALAMDLNMRTSGAISFTCGMSMLRGSIVAQSRRTSC